MLGRSLMSIVVATDPRGIHAARAGIFLVCRTGRVVTTFFSGSTGGGRFGGPHEPGDEHGVGVGLVRPDEQLAVVGRAVEGMGERVEPEGGIRLQKRAD